MKDKNKLLFILKEGETLFVEFKESFSDTLAKEIVGFANASGGSVFLGVDDDGKIKGILSTNSLKSRIQDLARNCDPSINIEIVIYEELKIIEIKIKEGENKPYSCKSGFYLRIGPSSQKLKRDEIFRFISQSSAFHFDEIINQQFIFDNNFSKSRFDKFLELSNISIKESPKDILESLNLGRYEDGEFKLKNAGILLFSKNPQEVFNESYITCIKYDGEDRFNISDKKDIYGNLIEQIEKSCEFFRDKTERRFLIKDARRCEIEEYPFVAFREALINAVVHRDYFYDHSHIYVHIFSNRLEIENPGGLFHGLKLDEFGKRSIRRNRLIADLLHRAKYIERVGSGVDRMKESLKENGNPKFEVTATNFFNIQFYPIKFKNGKQLSNRQRKIIAYLEKHQSLSKNEISLKLNVSRDTTIRELNSLIKESIIIREGVGRAILYKLVD
jgi:ATP-dependent DNA helicase RecG